MLIFMFIKLLRQYYTLKINKWIINIVDAFLYILIYLINKIFVSH